ncbi:MAG TPA: Yip1 family protein [Anaerolineales bacterium]|nr:Yip1 family protein [Anaerolineales bacterium]
MTNEIYQPTTTRKWYEIWWDVWSHPGMPPFQALLTEPNHSAQRGYIWIAVTSLIVVLLTGISSTLSIPDIRSQVAYFFIYFVCGVILSPFFAILGVIISAGIYHGIARLLGGTGKWSDLVICQCAITAPSELIAGLVSMIAFLFAIARQNFIFLSIFSFLLGIYGIVLNVNALKTSENINTGRAILTVFIPVIFVGLVVLCAIIALIPVTRASG